MAIVFSENRKKQRYLILIFVVVALLTAGIFWFGVLRKPSPELPAFSLPAKGVNIDFSVFKKPILKDLELFEEIPNFEGESYRENPFSPAPAPEQPEAE
ncbi:MAG: hypothetical protein Q8N16_04300 [bacterium]|nr:hypothetical protein [bacterium]